MSQADVYHFFTYSLFFICTLPPSTLLLYLSTTLPPFPIFPALPHYLPLYTFLQPLPVGGLVVRSELAALDRLPPGLMLRVPVDGRSQSFVK